MDADKEHKVREIGRNCKCKFSYTWLDKVVEIKQESEQSTMRKLGDYIAKTYTAGQQYLPTGKLLYKLKSVKPLSKEQAKQKGQNTGECTICPLKFQTFHGGPPYPLVAGGHPLQRFPPLSYASYGCIMLHFGNSWFWVILIPVINVNTNI